MRASIARVRPAKIVVSKMQCDSFLLKAFVSRVNRRIPIRMVKGRSMPTVVHIPVEFPDDTPPSKQRQVAKEVHDHARRLVAAPGTSPKNAGKSLGGLVGEKAPAKTAATRAAEELSRMLDEADAVPDDRANDKIYQGIIAYRKIARQLPEETRSALDRKIAAYSNARVSKKKK